MKNNHTMYILLAVFLVAVLILGIMAPVALGLSIFSTQRGSGGDATENSGADGGGNIPGLADISDIPIRPVSGGYGSAQGGFYQLPPSKYWESTSPSQNQRGSQCLVKLIAATSKAWKEKYPQDTIYVGDLNAPGHLSHSQGVDVDISTKRAANMNLSSYSRERTIEYGKLWFSTKLIEYIFFNDDSARPPIQNFAKQKGYPGIIMEEAGHEDHFHVRLKRGGDCGS